MIESMGESRWLDVEARERVELDLIKWFEKKEYRLYFLVTC